MCVKLESDLDALVCEIDKQLFGMYLIFFYSFVITFLCVTEWCLFCTTADIESLLLKIVA